MKGGDRDGASWLESETRGGAPEARGLVVRRINDMHDIQLFLGETGRITVFYSGTPNKVGVDDMN